MNCDNNQNNNGCGCNCNPNPAPAPADISMSVCDRNIQMLPMLQTYTTKVLKPNIEGCCKKNILTQQMMNCEGYKYVIKWDFDLDGKTITVPNNCILEFDGGSLKNGTIVAQLSGINAEDVVIFKNGITVSGSWNCPRIFSKWFEDIESNNMLKQLVNLSNHDIHNDIYIEQGNYVVSSVKINDYILDIKKNTTLYLNGTIRITPNSYVQYGIIRIAEDNITLEGTGSIIGDRINHTYIEGNTSEWCHGVIVGQSKVEREIESKTPQNIIIRGIHVENCPGDGIDVRSANNIVIENVTIDRCRRQGITLAYIENVDITNFKITNIASIDGVNYTAPGFGIDIEPDEESGYILHNIRITNGIINNVIGGICASINPSSQMVYEGLEVSNIYINGFIMYGIATFGFDNAVIRGCKIVGKGRGVGTNKSITIDSSYIDVTKTTYMPISGICDAIFNDPDHATYVNNSIIKSEQYLCRYLAQSRFVNCSIVSDIMEEIGVRSTDPIYSGYIINCDINMTSVLFLRNIAFIIDSVFDILKIEFTQHAALSQVKGNFFKSKVTENEIDILVRIQAEKVVLSENTIVLTDGSLYKTPVWADANLGCTIVNNHVSGTNTFTSREYIGSRTGNRIENYGLYQCQGVSNEKPDLLNNRHDLSMIGFTYFDYEINKPVYWRGDGHWATSDGATIDAKRSGTYAQRPTISWGTYEGFAYMLDDDSINPGKHLPIFIHKAPQGTTPETYVVEYRNADGAFAEATRSGNWINRPSVHTHIYEGFMYMINSGTKHFPIYAHIVDNGSSADPRYTIEWYKADGTQYTGS